jgi:hypothetical protein
MNAKDWNLWNNITFKTQAYRKNFDLVNENENIITEYDGVISKIRIEEQLPPLIIGEYGFSVWNIELGKKFGVNFDKLINEHSVENTYSELVKVIKNDDINIDKYNKLVLVHTLILHKDYRKRGMTEEFIEMLYRDFYSENVAIIMLVKPFQNNPIDFDFYFKRKSVSLRNKLRSKESTKIPAKEYYSMEELLVNTDTELIEYKLFAIANRCGFNRIDESSLFILTPEKVIERMKAKRNRKIIQYV